MYSKTIRTTLLGLAALSLAALPALAAGSVGETAPAFKLKGADGKTYSLAGFKGKTVVLEWVNPNCPFSDRHAREKTMSELHKQYGQVIAMNNAALRNGQPQAWMNETLGIAMELARATATPAPLSALTQQIWRTAADQARPDASVSELVRWVERTSGTEISAGSSPRVAP